MSKVTFLDDLNKAYMAELTVRRKRACAPYKNMHKDRWTEVCNTHNRKMIRSNRRSVGKSNKLGVRRTAKGMCGFLMEINMWAMICRNNRAIAAKSVRRPGDGN
ncbi:hypothetical protein [Serratia fonticola]|uniref:hypothetical protein n=1 Tax=Serratia fonticola TaxID=47917 RepID=UPI00093904DD|nr:hypothetical protein [Serratia fonticola]OKP30174.1 hypothetical protein BSQ40_06785 [Serratia fonticola]